jgi:hypothetical protein
MSISECVAAPADAPITHVEQAVHFFENISLKSLNQIHSIYTSDAFFKDPFNEFHGVDHIYSVFKHMFTQVNDPKFIVQDVIAQNNQAFLSWHFVFRMKRFDTKTLQTIRGSSHLKFSDTGQVLYHRDYWDAAEELYEKIPLLGSFMRALKRHANG